MEIKRLAVNTDAPMPLIAVLPYGVGVDAPADEGGVYDPSAQLTRFAGRGFSTCRSDESAGGLFQSKSDTHKDD